MKSTLPGVPLFKLYGENQAWPGTDLMHCESIPARSRLHHWEIKPHQHAELFQLLYVQRGQAQVEIEGVRSAIDEAAIQVVPPMTVHGFRFSADIQGYVLTFGTALVANLEQRLGAPLTVLAQPACYPLGHERVHLRSLIDTLQQEYQGNAPARAAMLEALVTALMVWISRRQQLGQAPRNRDERDRLLLGQYLRLVEAHYREHLSVEDFAARLNVPSLQLNQLCRALSGQTALQVVHQRLLLEARRNLIYTRMSIGQLSDSLGFTDPTYFARWFKRLSGQTPNGYRRSGQPD
ncbi:TPA: helix-turn-helix domain-containing protein [Pseudomonas putida]|uniref:Transcriptional regulator, AraC family n=1 Tax=Pseudomonas putida (strain GB-1) TaxID=76869 RepID=B0KPT5_PSEPG|nr:MULTISPECIES: helix-turn-helix domain-containing protein [Pseudomonas]ABY98285.1 transcriptional regulator, AraC family [Pseudomonas putida GB-1]APE98633.1 AraC family transcriptional regulator [Pseudomonas putida]MBP0709097.1 helix-turn-helix domain-containing protein [Pseudomonas sp. T34]MCE1002243.1 helix-turn-helix domain-containing protein [Pseudomonas sp. NMI1173_11]MCK2188537.1 helix-turn-helix domain-containing protein [Pseudomonas sp. MB04B]